MTEPQPYTAAELDDAELELRNLGLLHGSGKRLRPSEIEWLLLSAEQSIATVRAARAERDDAAEICRDEHITNAQWGATIATLEAEVARLRAVGQDIVSRFVHRGHPGRECLQTGWIPVDQVAKWNAALAATGEREETQG